MPDRHQPAFACTAAPVLRDGRLVDVALSVAGKIRHLRGRGGSGAERRFCLEAAGRPGVPVLFGCGLGAGLAALLEAQPGPVAVIDRQEPILAVTGVRERFVNDPRVVFIAGAADLAQWHRRLGHPRVNLIVDPAYQRLDPEYLGEIKQRLAALDSPFFRTQLDYPRFAAAAPRILMLDSGYFLSREIPAACQRLGYPLRRVAIAKPGAEADFIARLLTAAKEFKPDFALTVNHLGLDREGAISALLERMRLPLASWFVDSPRLILHEYARVVSPLAAVFSWDRLAMADLEALGFSHVFYLPLASDTRRFAPPKGAARPDHPWRAGVSFVGDSMRHPARDSAARLAAYPQLLASWLGLAEAFAAAPDHGAAAFIARVRPDLHADSLTLSDGARLALEMSLTWEATRLYRRAAVAALLPFSPLIAGDAGWENVLPGCGTAWRRLDPISYYRDLPRFYPLSEVNFNCTSRQMKGAANQRVFDVPACGAFLLTDHGEQQDELLAPGKEAAVYDHPGEIKDLARHYLTRPAEREALIRRGRERVLAEHAYVNRLQSLAEAMRRAFA